MNISNILSSTYLQTGIFDTASAQPVTNLFTPDTITSTATIPNATIVDISSLGNLLSVASTLGDGMLQSAATSSNGFATFVTAAQLFVDAFNNFLQSGLNGLQNPAGGLLASQFLQELNSQTTTTSSNGKSLIDSLASVGINFQTPSILNDTGQLTIDVQALKAAFTADATGTSTLLAQAFKSIAQLAAQFTSIVVQLENLTQIGTTSSSLATDALNVTPATLLTSATIPATTQTTTSATIPSSTAIASLVATTLLTAATTPATTTPPLTAIAFLTEAAQLAAAAQSTAAALLTAAGQLTTTAQPTVTGLPTTTTQAIATTPLAYVAATTQATTLPSPVASLLAENGQLATTAQPTVTALPTLTTQTTTTTPLAATLPATIPITTATALLLAAQPTVTVLPTTTTQPTVTSLPATTQLPITTALPTIATPLTAATSATPTRATATVTPPVTPSNLVNPFNVATDPAIAAALAAYHLVDGVFDTGMPRLAGLTPSAFSYSDIWPVTKIRPVRFDRYA